VPTSTITITVASSTSRAEVAVTTYRGTCNVLTR
jgi:hypothetical protein